MRWVVAHVWPWFIRFLPIAILHVLSLQNTTSHTQTKAYRLISYAENSAVLTSSNTRSPIPISKPRFHSCSSPHLFQPISRTVAPALSPTAASLIRGKTPLSTKCLPPVPSHLISSFPLFLSLAASGHLRYPPFRRRGSPAHMSYQILHASPWTFPHCPLLLMTGWAGGSVVPAQTA